MTESHRDKDPFIDYEDWYDSRFHCLPSDEEVKRWEADNPGSTGLSSHPKIPTGHERFGPEGMSMQKYPDPDSVVVPY